MEQKEILTKIKKLMRLSSSNNPHEAALALERAMELMSKYSVSAETLRMSEVEECTSRAFKTKTLTDYQIRLLNAIMKLFGCACYQTTSCPQNKWLSQPVFIGINPNVEIAAYCFEVLSRKQEKARVEYMATLNKRLKRTTKIQRGNEFALGWALGVKATVSTMVPEIEMKAVVTEYFNKKKSGLGVATDRKTKISKTASAMSSGYITGSKVDINKPVAGKNGVLELG